MLKVAKRLVKAVLLRAPGGKAALRLYKHYTFQRRVGPFSDSNELFTRFYATNHWGNAESVSGPGSTLRRTEHIRVQISTLIREQGFRRVLDAPCGDYNWFRMVERSSDVAYIGADIVQPLISRNNERFASANTSFQQLDITQDPLPFADLWICRDVLFHLSERDVLRALRNLLHSDIGYLLTTSYTHCEFNDDIPTGSFREINLERPPFNLPRAELYIDDSDGGRHLKSLCLWQRDAVATALGRKSQG